MIIKRTDQQLVLSCVNPFFEKTGISKSYFVISFSPAGNGYFSRNLATGTTFQDDLVRMFHDIMNEDTFIKKK